MKFEDFRGIEFTARDLHRRLVTVFTEVFHSAWEISRARSVEELELAVKKAEALVRIAEELVKLYDIIVRTAENLYKK